MGVADEHQVAERCRAAVRPMLDVMRVNESGIAAAGEAPAAIAQPRRAQGRWRHGAAASSDVEHIAALVGLCDDESAVICETQQCGAIDCGAIV
jgi:hypothetical protein